MIRRAMFFLTLAFAGCHQDDEEIVTVSSPVPGSLDSTFGTGGVITSNPSPGTDSYFCMTIDASFVYLGTRDSTAGNFGAGVEKRSLSTGALDPGFGTGGIVTINPTPGIDGSFGIAADATFLYILIEENAATAVWRVEKRTIATGALDPGFGAGGVINMAPSTTDIDALSILIDATSMYLVGEENSPGNSQWRIEKRLLSTGALDGAFGVAGVVTSNPSAGPDRPRSALLDSTSIYIVGEDEASGNLQWRIEKRSLATGALDGTFGAGGVVVNDPSANPDNLISVAADGTWLYLGGHDMVPGNHRWRIEKRSMSTGALDPAFGTGGVVTADHSSGSDQLMDVKIASNGRLYVAGIDSSAGNFGWRVERRMASTGALDPEFAVDGAVATNPSAGFDVVYRLAVDGSSIYLAGEDSIPGNREYRLEKRIR